ncbi:hypothetical protein M8494_31035 [Serratia ureilytica]
MVDPIREYPRGKGDAEGSPEGRRGSGAPASMSSPNGTGDCRQGRRGVLLLLIKAGATYRALRQQPFKQFAVAAACACSARSGC